MPNTTHHRRPRAPRGQALEILRLLASIDHDACTEWPYAASDRGYGRVVVDGKVYGTHVIACTWHHGPRPAKRMEVAHSCGVPSCVNPAHLRWATPTENAADKLIHGTENIGARNHRTKLDPECVVEIRRLLAAGHTFASIAQRFDVTPGAVSGIASGRSWRRVA